MQKLNPRKLAAVIAVALAATPLVAAREINIGINAEPGSLDPQHAPASIVGSRFYGFVYDQLTRLDSEGRLAPMLATSWEADGTAWRFALREDVLFHDGSSLTAGDVVYSLERLLYSDYESPVRGGFLPFIESVEATGEFEVTITTPQPDPLLPLRLASPAASIVPAAATEALGYDTMQTAPIAAGPYRVVSWEPGSMIVLDAFADYWAGAPAAERVILHVIPENSTRVAALRSGELDMITTIPPDLLAEIENSAGLAVSSAEVLNYMHIYFNTHTGPTSNAHLRRALSLLIDRELITQALWGGRVNVVTDYFLPGEFGFDAAREAFPYDPEAAARELELAGYAGEVVNFNPPSTYYTNGRLVTDVIAEMWTAGGINVNYEPLELAQWAELSIGGQQTATLQSFGTAGDAGTSFVNELISGAWVGQYYPVSEEFRALASEAAVLLDQDARYANYRRIAEILDEDVPYAPLYRSVEFYGLRDDIDWQPHPSFLIDFRPGNLSFR